MNQPANPLDSVIDIDGARVSARSALLAIGNLLDELNAESVESPIGSGVRVRVLIMVPSKRRR